MCGIIYSKNLQDEKAINALVKIIYQNQKSRGSKGFGFIGMNARRLDTYRSIDEKGILRYLNRYPYDEILLHHRLPTSTPNTLQTTHPFVLSHEGSRYYFIHNGVIVNSIELKNHHYKQGIRYTSMDNMGKFNDSEALAWEFVLSLQQNDEQLAARGSAAFICLETDSLTSLARKLYFFSDGNSPLKIYHDMQLLVISSEGRWGVDVEENQLFYFDYSSKKLKKGRALHLAASTASRQNSWSYWGSHNFYNAWDIQQIERQIMALEQEQEYLHSIGEHAKANSLDEEIDNLWGTI